MRQLLAILRDMQTRQVYGSVTIHFRDGRIAAVNRTETERLELELPEERKVFEKMPRIAFRQKSVQVN